MNLPSPLKALREKAARGAILTHAEVAEFVAAARKSFLARPAPKTKADRTAKPPTANPDQIDFF